MKGWDLDERAMRIWAAGFGRRSQVAGRRCGAERLCVEQNSMQGLLRLGLNGGYAMKGWEVDERARRTWAVGLVAGRKSPVASVGLNDRA
jgi:hypothetical protein